MSSLDQSPITPENQYDFSSFQENGILYVKDGKLHCDKNTFFNKLKQYLPSELLKEKRSYNKSHIIRRIAEGIKNQSNKESFKDSNACALFKKTIQDRCKEMSLSKPKNERLLEFSLWHAGEALEAANTMKEIDKSFTFDAKKALELLPTIMLDKKAPTEILRDSGASSQEWQSKWQTPFFKALFKAAESDGTVVKSLTETLTMQNKNGDTPLHTLSSSIGEESLPAFFTFASTQPKVMESLTETLTMQNKNGDTPLHTLSSSIGKESLPAFFELASKNAVIADAIAKALNMPNKQNFTPLRQITNAPEKEPFYKLAEKHSPTAQALVTLFEQEAESIKTLKISKPRDFPNLLKLMANHASSAQGELKNTFTSSITKHLPQMTLYTIHRAINELDDLAKNDRDFQPALNERINNLVKQHTSESSLSNLFSLNHVLKKINYSDLNAQKLIQKQIKAKITSIQPGFKPPPNNEIINTLCQHLDQAFELAKEDTVLQEQLANILLQNPPLDTCNISLSQSASTFQILRDPFRLNQIVMSRNHFIALCDIAKENKTVRTTLLKALTNESNDPKIAMQKSKDPEIQQAIQNLHKHKKKILDELLEGLE